MKLRRTLSVLAPNRWLRVTTSVLLAASAVVIFTSPPLAGVLAAAFALLLATVVLSAPLALRRPVQSAEQVSGDGDRATRQPRPGTPASRVVRPPPLASFRGRRHELKELRDRLQQLRQPNGANGAIILAIHGMPGVGKSALAIELARELAAEFPDGLLYASLGNAGNIRAEADILNRFLIALGLPDEEIPESTLDRAARFRSATTSRQVLVILDAARDHQQVIGLLPSGEQCAVIVTSRRNLGPALGVDSLLLRVPDMDDALDLLRAVTRIDREFAENQKFAIEIVERVGRLPLAIRAAGEQVTREEASLKSVARLLRTILPGDGSGVDERISSEYGRLTAAERRAFELLSLIDSPTFVPWVLVPLLGFHADGDYAEAEKLVSRLAERQLLEPAGRDDFTGIDRYRLHPVCRVFAEHRRQEGGEDGAAARRNLDEAYLEAIDLILAEVEPSYRTRNPRRPRLRWFPEGSTLPRHIAVVPDKWVRQEYRNLVRAVHTAAAAERWELCWRIGAWLGQCGPNGDNVKDALDALMAAQDAAAKMDDRYGLAAVSLARGTVLAGMERYPEAYDALAAAAQAANQLRPPHPGNWLLPAPRSGMDVLFRPRLNVPRQRGGPRSAVRSGFALECKASRRLAEAYLRLGAYRDAGHELARAALLARTAKDAEQAALIAMMRLFAGDDFAEADLPKVDGTHDDGEFWRELTLAELDRRRHRWPDASRRLRALRHRFEDDPVRACGLLCRLAEIRLEELQFDSAKDRRKASVRAVHRSAEALWGYQRLQQGAGAVRARCLLVRALLSMNLLVEAGEQWRLVAELANDLDPYFQHEWSPLRAVMWRAEGELLRRRGSVEAGSSALLRAARIFHAHGDRTAEATTLALQGLTELPMAAFESQPPGREPRISLNVESAPADPSPVYTVTYSLDPPAFVTRDHPVGGRYLDVLLVSEGAEVTPPVQTVRLDSWAPLGPLTYQVACRHSRGPIQLRLMVYSTGDGSLLQELAIVVADKIDASRGGVPV